MRILQLNLNHCEVAQDLLLQRVKELEADVAMLSEQYKNHDTKPWVSDSTKKAAIWACGRYPFQELSRDPEPWFVRAKVGGVHFYSCYSPPSAHIRDYEEFLDRLTEDVKKRDLVAIAGDFNAWATDWGSRETDARGQALLDAFSSLNLVLLNTGNVSTFRRGSSSSIVDLTFVTSALAKSCGEWRVDEEFTNSDHQAIVWEINTTPTSKRPGNVRGQLKGWNRKMFDRDAFLVMMEDEKKSPVTSTEGRVRDVMGRVCSACDASMPRKRPNTRHFPVCWWSDTISQLRKECLKARRQHQRARKKNRETTAALRLEYELKRRDLRIAIRGSKRSCWKELCSEVDQDPWGRPYKTVMHRIKSLPMNTPTCPDTLRKIVQHLFPEKPEIRTGTQRLEVDEGIPPITLEELMKASSRLGNTKSPGPDGIPNIALKAAIHSRPDMFLDMYNACLREGVFPDQWKRQRLVLLPKGKKPPDEPSSYRPLCMLDSAGKILERIIYNRLEQQVDDKLSEHQFGFRKGRSTIDAVKLVVDIARKATSGKRWKRGSKKYCLIATLDIKNAFNSARWDCIRESLDRLGVPWYLKRIVSRYLSNRILIYETEAGPREYKVTGGVPQGSVLGPLLWNIMYDGLLQLHLPDGVNLVAFADDVAVVIVRKHLEELTTAFSGTMKTVETWMQSVSLVLAKHKTEALLVTGRKKRENITLVVGGHIIESKQYIRYLGVILDARLSFREHVAVVSCKASAVSGALTRVMPNIGGPRQIRRKLLATVVTSILLYGAPVWAHTMELMSYSRIMTSIQRLLAIRVASSYRTVSQDAVCVIASVFPIDILAAERSRIYHRGTLDPSVKSLICVEERTASLRHWQERWDNSSKGRWTYRLIPNIDRWINRANGEVGYYLTQLLSGHGCFRAYLFRFKAAESSVCPHCSDAQEDAEHVFFYCSRFCLHRHHLESLIGAVVTPGNLVDCMLQSAESWNAVATFAEEIIKILRSSLSS